MSNRTSFARRSRLAATTFATGICVIGVGCKSPTHCIPKPTTPCASIEDVIWLAENLPANLDDVGFSRQGRVLDSIAYCMEAEDAE